MCNGNCKNKCLNCKREEKFALEAEYEGNKVYLMHDIIFGYVFAKVILKPCVYTKEQALRGLNVYAGYNETYKRIDELREDENEFERWLCVYGGLIPNLDLKITEYCGELEV